MRTYFISQFTNIFIWLLKQYISGKCIELYRNDKKIV